MSQQGIEKSIFSVIFWPSFYVITKMTLQNINPRLGGRRLPKFWSPISQKNYPKITQNFDLFPTKNRPFPTISQPIFAKFPALRAKKSQNFSHPQKLQNLHLKNSNFLTKLGKFLKENEKNVSKIPKIFWENLKNPNFFLKMLNYPKFS